MKKVLYAILFLSLLSFLIAEVKICDVNDVMVCYDENTINSCECVPMNSRGKFAFSTKCIPPEQAICKEIGVRFTCYCDKISS